MPLTVLPVLFDRICIPAPALPEMTLRAVERLPPIVLSCVAVPSTTPNELGSADAPLAVVPMKFPAITVRSVAVDNSSVLAAQTYTLPFTPDIKAMIDVRATPPAWRAAVSYGHEGVIGAADPGLGYVHVLQAQAPPSPTGPIPLAGRVSGQGVAEQIATLPPEQRKMVQDACAARRSGVAGPLGSPTAVIVEPLTQIDLSTACSYIR